jgi:hypothetical protein
MSFRKWLIPEKITPRTVEGMIYVVAVVGWIWVGVSENYAQKAFDTTIGVMVAIGNSVTYHRPTR